MFDTKLHFASLYIGALTLAFGVESFFATTAFLFQKAAPELAGMFVVIKISVLQSAEVHIQITRKVLAS